MHGRGDVGAAEPRFLAARHEFANAFGDLARGKRNWQLVAFWSLGLLTVSVVSYIRIASSARVVPYVIEVDKLGQVIAAREAAIMRPPEPRLISSQLAGFVRAVRTVLPASLPRIQSDVMRRAYMFVDQGSSAAVMLNTYFADPSHDPRLLGQTITRQVDIASTLPVPGSATWKVRWTETEYPLVAGMLGRVTAWEGYVTVRLQPPTTVDAVQDNPLGVFITSINWTQITDNGGTAQ
jgi:type IV secretory pathway TrbF-like protein